MKKTIIILFVVLAGLCAILFLLKYQKSQQNIKFNKISEEILGYSLPDQYTAIAATQTNNTDKQTSKYGSVIVLSGENEHTILILEGPPISNIKKQKDLLLMIQNNLYHLSNNKYTNYAKITPSKEKPADNPELITYDITINNQEDTIKGVASFLNYPDKTLLYICLAPKKSFIRQIAYDFLDELDAHNDAIYQVP